MSHKVEIIQTGRGGTINYTEQDTVLSFDWEFATNGADMFVPAPAQWAAYCHSRSADWAANHREEILERVAAEVRKQKAASSNVTIEDNWVHFEF